MNNVFRDNHAKKDGGVVKMKVNSYEAYMYSGIEVHIVGSTFENNSAGARGDVFSIFPIGTFSVDNSSFINNHAGSYGGVLNMFANSKNYHSQLSVSESSFEYNRADLCGGVFSSFTPTSYLIDSSSFTGNLASRDGGVMYVESVNSEVRITDGLFSVNSATDKGGVISINGSKVNITILNNSADVGDVILACNCDVSITSKLPYYTDSHFPNCTIYGYRKHQGTTTCTVPVSGPTIPAYIVATSLAIPTGGLLVIVTVLTVTLLAYLYRKGLLNVKIQRLIINA